MRHIAGTIGGFCSGFLLYMMATMIMTPMGKVSSGYTGTLMVIFFLGGWIVTHYFIAKGTTGFAKPMARAFLIGSCEWLFMIVAGVIVSGKAMTATLEKMPTSDAAQAGAALGSGMFAFLTGAISIGMAIACAIGCLAFHFMGQEGSKAMSADEKQKRCPECAEMVNELAFKCRHCSHSFSQELKKAV
jgi:hypothetical protein